MENLPSVLDWMISYIVPYSALLTIRTQLPKRLHGRQFCDAIVCVRDGVEVFEGTAIEALVC